MPGDPDGAVLDVRGRVMFRCGVCGAPIRADDFFDLGMRLPDADETTDDYCEAELVDRVDHAGCLRRSGAAAS